MRKTLLLIPSVVKTGLEAEVAQDRHPTMDYHALAAALRDRHGLAVDILDYAAVDADSTPAVRLARKAGGRDAALAALAYARRDEYAAIFSNGENVGVPLALLLGLGRRGPGHVTIGHRLSARKKQSFFSGC